MKHLKLLYLFIVLFLFSCEEEPAITPTPECILTENLNEVVEELNAIAHPISGAEYNRPDAELAALDTLFSNVKVVALGEATHGTMEFFMMKHRLFKYLVEHHDFKAIVFEANFGNTMAVNDYVMGGSGNIDDVVDEMLFWTWDTDEVKALVEWMRTYNSNQPANKKIYFVGSDCQYTAAEMQMVSDYLDQVDPAFKTIVDSLYQPFAGLSFEYESKSSAFKNDVQANIQAVIDGMEDKANQYINASDEKSYQLALQAAKVIQQTEIVLGGSEPTARDRYMGENTLWWADYLGTNTKVAYWAHNFHIMTHTWGWNTAGAQIKSIIEDDFLSIGFSFSTGYFNAVQEYSHQNYGPLISHFIDEPLCRSVNDIFHEADAEQFYLIMDEIGTYPKLDGFLRSEQNFISIGAIYNRSRPNDYYIPMTIKQFFDVIIHFDYTRASAL